MKSRHKTSQNEIVTSEAESSVLMPDAEQPDSVINLSDASKENALEVLYDHFIKEKNGDPIPFDSNSKVGLFLELLGGTGGIYAWPPALKYGRKFAPWITRSFAISNPVSNVLFLIKATDDLADTIQAEARVPEEIAMFMVNDEKTKKNLIAKYSKMAVGSLVCVIPFAIAVYLFPLPGCDESWCLGLTLAHSTVSNTILHGIAWALVFTPQFWYYRLPVLPLEKLYSLIKTACYNPIKREQSKLIEEQLEIVSRYKSHLINVFKKSLDEIIKQKSYTRRRQMIEEGDALHSLTTIQSNGASLITLAEFSPSPSSAYSSIASQSYARRMFNTIHGVLSNGVIGFLGGGIMIAGCIGWIANPIYVGLLEGLSLPASITAGALPLYSTAVLCAFYGAAIFNQIYAYLTTWTGSFEDKFSLEVKMYPLTFLLFTLFNVYVSFFSFATATQLINTIFSDSIWSEARPVLAAISIPTLQILSFIPLMELFNQVVRKLQAKFGSRTNDETLAARLLVKMPLLIHYLQHMKGDELMNGIARYSSQQKTALKIDLIQFQADFDDYFNLQTNLDQLQTKSSDKVEIKSKSAAPHPNGFFSSSSPRSGEQTSLIAKPGY